MLRNSYLFLFALLIPVSQAYSNEGMLCLVNNERTQRGLPAMGLDPLLTKAAQQHSDDQARMNSMSHTGSDGSQPSQRLTNIGFNWSRMAENVAYGYADSTTCMQAWMNSEGHRENILGPCQMFGSGVGYSGSTPYYTQDFGTDGGGCRNVPQCNGGTYVGGSSASAPAPAPAPAPSYGSQPQMPNYGGGGGGGNSYGGNNRHGGGKRHGGRTNQWQPSGGRWSY